MSINFMTTAELLDYCDNLPHARILDGKIRCEYGSCNKPAVYVDINPHHQKRIAAACKEAHAIGGYPIELSRIIPEWNDWIFHLAEKTRTNHLVDLINWLGRSGFQALGGNPFGPAASPTN